MLTAPLMAGTEYDDQVRLESESMAMGIERYHRHAGKAIKRGEGALLKPVERMVLHWLGPIGEMVKVYRTADYKGAKITRPYLRMIEPDVAATIASQIALSTLIREGKPHSATKVANAIGRGIASEINRKNYKGLDDEQKVELNRLIRRRRRATPEVINAAYRAVSPDWVMPVSYMVTVGATMLHLLIEYALADYDAEKVTPAFIVNMVREGRKLHRRVELSGEVKQIIAAGHKRREGLRPRYLPMIMPPMKWVKDADGGYVSIRTPMMSRPRRLQKQRLAEALGLDTVYQAQYDAGREPMAIDAKNYRVIEALWEEGGGELGIPMLENPPKPIRPVSADDDKATEKKWKRSARDWYKATDETLPAERSSFLGSLRVAETFLSGQPIWFPHQFDFRGRLYPLPQPLNHQGDDLNRGMLRWAHKRPIKGDALASMAIEAANSWGEDKCDFSGRIDWTTRNLDDMVKSARDPLGYRWWMQADKPFQFLAACRAMDKPDVDGLTMVCRTDGTCNGVQHFAAMMRDEETASWVNMLPMDGPRDLYSRVAEEVADMIRRRPEDDDFEAMLEHAVRKVCKTPVMTKSYDVTDPGVRQQIRDALKGRGVEDAKDRSRIAAKMTKMILEAIGVVCPQIEVAMSWIRNGAAQIAEAGYCVEWTTPLGFPVVQEYRDATIRKITTPMGKMLVGDFDRPGRVKIGKQRRGAAPNFVHSIDATHMMMTAMECAKRDIAFAAVHDSYWSHPADMDTLSLILREQFVELHKVNQLARLRGQWLRQYPDVTFAECPSMGSYNVESVLDALYFFN